MATNLKHLNVDAFKVAIDDAAMQAKDTITEVAKRAVRELLEGQCFLLTAPPSLAELLATAEDARVVEFEVERTQGLPIVEARTAQGQYIDLHCGTGRFFGHGTLRPGRHRLVVLVLPCAPENGGPAA